MNNNKLSKVLTFIALIIGLIGVFFYVRVLIAGDDSIEIEADLQNAIISPFVWITLVVLIATIAAAVLSSILGLIKKPEQLKKTVLSIAVLGVLLAVSYVLRDGTEVLDAKGVVLDGGTLNSTSNVWSSTGIWFSVILGGIGLAMFLVDMVKGLVKS